MQLCLFKLPVYLLPKSRLWHQAQTSNEEQQGRIFYVVVHLSTIVNSIAANFMHGIKLA